MKTLLAAASVLVLSAGIAAAAPAVTQSSVNMRSGPGAQFPVVATLPGNAAVDVGGCDAGWCAVNWNGRDGYVSAGYLATAGASPAVAVAPGYYDDDYDDDPGVYVGPNYYGGPRWHQRDNWRGPRPGGPVIGRPGVPQPGFAGPPAAWRGNPGINQGFRGPMNAPTGLRGPGFGAPLASPSGPAFRAPAPAARTPAQGFGTPLAR